MSSIVKQAAQKSFIDWGFVLANCGPSMKKPITDAITRNEELFRLVHETKAERPKIQFDHYRRALQSDPDGPSFVDSCQQSVQKFAPTESNQQQELAAIQSEHENLMSQTAVFSGKLQKKIEEIKQRLSKFSALPPLEQVTMSHIADIFPETKAECDERVRHGFWSIDRSYAEYEEAARLRKAHHH